MPVRQMHRETFFAHNGIGPYPCFVCGTLISFYDQIVIHHIDENHGNNFSDNLSAIHHGCHSRLHQKGSTRSDEARARMSAANSGRRLSVAHKLAIAKAGRQRIWSDETRAKMSASQKGRVFTSEHRAKISSTLKNRVTPSDRQRFALMGKRGAASRWKGQQNG